MDLRNESVQRYGGSDAPTMPQPGIDRRIAARVFVWLVYAAITAAAVGVLLLLA